MKSEAKVYNVVDDPVAIPKALTAMKAPPEPIAEITTTAIALLCGELGAVNSARFLNQFTTGLGNYAEE